MYHTIRRIRFNCYEISRPGDRRYVICADDFRTCSYSRTSPSNSYTVPTRTFLKQHVNIVLLTSFEHDRIRLLVVRKFVPLAISGPLSIRYFTHHNHIGRIIICAQPKLASIVTGNPEGVFARFWRINITLKPGPIAVYVAFPEFRGFRPG